MEGRRVGGVEEWRSGGIAIVCKGYVMEYNNESRQTLPCMARARRARFSRLIRDYLTKS